MGKWYEPKKKDIEITQDGISIQAWLETDAEFCNVYVSLNIEEVRELIEEHIMKALLK